MDGARIMQCGLRVILAWLVPLVMVSTGHNPGIFIPILSALLATTEVVAALCCRTGAKKSDEEKVEKGQLATKVFGRVLLGVYLLQVCSLAVASENPLSAPELTDYVSAPPSEAKAEPIGFQLDAPAETLKFSASTLSVILPCAEEREYALKTVQSVFENTPSHVLREIIVVDDGSTPPLSETVLKPDVQQQYKVKIMRHDRTVGLIGAKKTGGDVATGDVLAFFDCHVAPQPNWYKSFLSLVGENYRRMVVPGITALDVGTWKQKGAGGGVAKCYLTWDADFKWFDSDDRYIAVISGGLLGMSRRWWQETGGYDKEMLGWGGENLDQSLRVWLCGGEIVFAQESHVAHMWRTGDQRTTARYKRVGDTSRNRARAVYGWYGEFAPKLMDYPAFANRRTPHGSTPWYGDLTEYDNVRKGCGGGRPFAWFLRRFRRLYEDGGMIPMEIFMLKEEKSGLCLHYSGSAGTSQNGFGQAHLKHCNTGDHRFFWHLGNKDTKNGGRCCSGLRAWNTDQCLNQPKDGGVQTAVCDVSGRNWAQYWSLTQEGQLTRRGKCMALSREGGDQVSESICLGLRASGGSRWTKEGAVVPLETRLYRKAQREKPHIFGSMGVQHAAMEKIAPPEKCKETSSSCVTVMTKDGTHRCFDEFGMLTTAHDYCSVFFIPDATASSVRHMETGKCLDQMNDDDPDTWGLVACNSRNDQHFAPSKDGDGDGVCAETKNGRQLCFETKTLGVALS